MPLYPPLSSGVLICPLSSGSTTYSTVEAHNSVKLQVKTSYTEVDMYTWAEWAFNAKTIGRTFVGNPTYSWIRYPETAITGVETEEEIQAQIDQLLIDAVPYPENVYKVHWGNAFAGPVGLQLIMNPVWQFVDDPGAARQVLYCYYILDSKFYISSSESTTVVDDNVMTLGDWTLEITSTYY